MKVLRRIQISLFLIIISQAVSHAQQEPQFTQNMFYDMYYNPGFAGNVNAICAVGSYRYQWAGFKDSEGNHVAPETYFITVNAPVKILRGGLSAYIMSDNIGYEKTIAVKLGYAYQKRIGFGRLGIGAQFAFNNRTLDFSKLDAVEDNDPILSSQGEESDMLIDFSLGLYYRVPGSYYIGISGVNLLQSDGKAIATTTNGEFALTLDRTFYLLGGYEFVFPGNPAWLLKPSLLFKTNMSSMQLDLAALLEYKEKFWGGLSYRLQDAVAIIIGMQFKDFKIGYSYDINISKLKMPVGGGTHEVMLSYCFKLETEKGRKSYKNTRFL